MATFIVEIRCRLPVEAGKKGAFVAHHASHGGKKALFEPGSKVDSQHLDPSQLERLVANGSLSQARGGRHQ